MSQKSQILSQHNKKYFMSLNRIYTYWEGPMPDYIQMCRESLYRHCKDFEIIDVSHIKSNLPINLKVDLLKGQLIRDNGGFWIDADMIVMKPLTPLIKLLDKTNFMGLPGFFAGKAGAPILKDWVESMEKRINAAKELNVELSFSSLIHPLLSHGLYKPYKYLTHEMVTPIWNTGDEFWEFFKDDNKLEDFITDNTYIVTLYNSQFSDDFKNSSRDRILKEGWLISRMFKKALYENT